MTRSYYRPSTDSELRQLDTYLRSGCLPGFLRRLLPVEHYRTHVLKDRLAAQTQVIEFDVVSWARDKREECFLFSDSEGQHLYLLGVKLLGAELSPIDDECFYDESDGFGSRITMMRAPNSGVVFDVVIDKTEVCRRLTPIQLQFISIDSLYVSAHLDEVIDVLCKAADHVINSSA